VRRQSDPTSDPTVSASARPSSRREGRTRTDSRPPVERGARPAQSTATGLRRGVSFTATRPVRHRPAGRAAHPDTRPAVRLRAEPGAVTRPSAARIGDGRASANARRRRGRSVAPGPSKGDSALEGGPGADGQPARKSGTAVVAGRHRGGERPMGAWAAAKLVSFGGGRGAAEGAAMVAVQIRSDDERRGFGP
jgi:hypothetical protein